MSDIVSQAAQRAQVSLIARPLTRRTAQVVRAASPVGTSTTRSPHSRTPIFGSPPLLPIVTRQQSTHSTSHALYPYIPLITYTGLMMDITM